MAGILVATFLRIHNKENAVNSHSKISMFLAMKWSINKDNDELLCKNIQIINDEKMGSFILLKWRESKIKSFEKRP